MSAMYKSNSKYSYMNVYSKNNKKCLLKERHTTALFKHVCLFEFYIFWQENIKTAVNSDFNSNICIKRVFLAFMLLKNFLFTHYRLWGIMQGHISKIQYWQCKYTNSPFYSKFAKYYSIGLQWHLFFLVLVLIKKKLLNTLET